MQTHISEKSISVLAEYGISVYRETNLAHIAKFNTDLYILMPDGRRIELYDELWKIPVLPPHTEVSLTIDNNQIPYEIQKLNCGTYLHLDPQLEAELGREAYEQMEERKELVPWATVLFAIIILVIVGILCIFLFAFLDRINIVHGKEWQIQEVDTATKGLTKPNCQARLWDSENHEFIEGDDWSEPGTTPGEELGNWIKYLIYGFVAIAGVTLLSTFIKSRERKAYYAAYPAGYGYEPPPPPPRGMIERGVEAAARGAKKGAKKAYGYMRRK